MKEYLCEVTLDEDAKNLCKLLNHLAEENMQLKYTLSAHIVDLDNYKEKSHQLQERNNRQAKQLDTLYNLIEQKNWNGLIKIIDELNKAEELLQKEWGTYSE